MERTGPVLVVAATEKELPAGLRDEAAAFSNRGLDTSPRWKTLVSGVGPVEAAVATAAAIAAIRPSAILQVGIAGARRDSGLEPPALVIGGESHYIDFAAGSELAPTRVHASFPLLAALRRAFPAWPIASIATTARVGSSISATECLLEAMEGFAVLRAAEQAGIPAIELRAISNMIGETDRALWQFDSAFKAIADAVPSVAAVVYHTVSQR